MKTHQKIHFLMDSETFPILVHLDLQVSGTTTSCSPVQRKHNGLRLWHIAVLLVAIVSIPASSTILALLGWKTAGWCSEPHSSNHDIIYCRSTCKILWELATHNWDRIYIVTLYDICIFYVFKPVHLLTHGSVLFQKNSSFSMYFLTQRSNNPCELFAQPQKSVFSTFLNHRSRLLLLLPVTASGRKHSAGRSTWWEDPLKRTWSHSTIWSVPLGPRSCLQAWMFNFSPKCLDFWLQEF